MVSKMHSFQDIGYQRFVRYINIDGCGPFTVVNMANHGIITGILILNALLVCHGDEFVIMTKGNVDFELLVDTKNNLGTVNLRDVTQLKLTSQLGTNLNLTDLKKVENEQDCFHSEQGNYKLCIFSEGIEDGFKISWHSSNKSAVFQDCISLGKESKTHWYGGHEIYEQLWPIEKLKTVDYPYITNGLDNSAVKETYWLNSLGAYVFVDRTVPLYLDINNVAEDHLCFIAKLGDTYEDREVTLNYTIVSAKDPKVAHLHAVKNHFGRPTAHPDNKMIGQPIWTTWAKYKRDINDTTVIDFANDVNKRGYFGQIEIDDAWETCYGQREFDTENSFKDIKDTVQKLKKMGFRVTLWTHPFVNNNCPDARLGELKGYFATGSNGSTNTTWWNGDDAHMIDFTKTEASDWFVNKLNKIQELYGIDGFKFDAGEATFAPKKPQLNASINERPNKITEDYLRVCAKFGNLTEVRSGWNTQDLEIFVRMLDKDSKWGYDNGLKSLITTLLQMNMVGYGFVLPDMVGGNGYQEPPSPELLVRWAQANVFMPAVQFSYLPWDITSSEFDVPKIVKEAIDLHHAHAGDIIQAMEKFIQDGTPVNGPVWWLDPSDRDLLRVDDQYLLGENILVAPVVEQGAVKRNIVFPKGKWIDGNYGNVITGPTTVYDYPAAINVLPWFQKED